MLAHQHVAGVLLELVSGMPVLMCDSPYPHSIRSKNPARDSPTTSGIFAFRFMSNAVLTGTGPNAKYCAAITPRQPLAQRRQDSRAEQHVRHSHKSTVLSFERTIRAAQARGNAQRVLGVPPLLRHSKFCSMFYPCDDATCQLHPK